MNLLDPPETVSLQTMSEGPIVEGDNVTLECQADGNPLPTSFVFHIKVSQRQRLLQELKRSRFKGHSSVVGVSARSPDQAAVRRSLLL